MSGYHRGPLKTSIWEVQKAIYNRLSNDPILLSMVSGVYDEIPEGTSFPYVQIGDDTISPYDTKTNYGENITVTLHAWSMGPGKTEAKQIMNVILQAITANPLTVTGFTITGVEREFLEVFYDGLAYHGVCRFRIYTQQN